VKFCVEIDHKHRHSRFEPPSRQLPCVLACLHRFEIASADSDCSTSSGNLTSGGIVWTTSDKNLCVASSSTWHVYCSRVL
jgi:hypothetical protein